MTKEDNDDPYLSPRDALTPEELEKLSKLVSRAVKDMMKSFSSGSPDSDAPYGFNIRVDENGVPIIERARSQRPHVQQPQHSYQQVQPPKPNPNEATPLVDIEETQKAITVTMEMRGAEKGSIALSVGNRQVSVRSATRNAQTTQTVALPSPVNPASAKAHYRNGILEIRASKSKSAPQKTVSVEVE